MTRRPGQPGSLRGRLGVVATGKNVTCAGRPHHLRPRTRVVARRGVASVRLVGDLAQPHTLDSLARVRADTKLDTVDT